MKLVYKFVFAAISIVVHFYFIIKFDNAFNYCTIASSIAAFFALTVLFYGGESIQVSPTKLKPIESYARLSIQKCTLCDKQLSDFDIYHVRSNHHARNCVSCNNKFKVRVAYFICGVTDRIRSKMINIINGKN